ncbi:MAG: peptidoglycan-binding domain-containing protein, partial [Ruthenibacterium sp.]
NVLVLGSAGLQVYRLQTYMNSIAERYCAANFVPQDGVLGLETMRAVMRFQQGFALPVTGFVDRATWDAIYAFYQNGIER